MRFMFYFLLSAGACVLLLGSSTSVCAQGVGSTTLSRPTNPLTHDPRSPNSYDLEYELRNSKIGKEVEVALREGNDAYNAQPPRYVDAEKSYLRAVKLEPKEARAYLGLGRVYAAQNQVDKTISAFKKAVEVKPKFAEGHFNLGLVYFVIGKKDEALKEQQILMTLNKDLAKKLKDTINK